MQDAPSGRRPSPTERARWYVLLPVLTAFLAAIASFVGSSLYADRQAAGIHANAVAIASDAAPSIALLSAARSELHRIQALTASYVSDSLVHRPIDRTVLDQARSELGRDLRSYLALPTYPAEEAARRVISANLTELDANISRMMRLVTLGAPEEANEFYDTQLRESILRTSDALVATIDINAREARSLAVSIEQSRGRSHRIGMALDAVSVALALVAFGIAIRFVVRYLDISRRHAQYVERRADELEQFAGRVAHDVLGPLTSVGLALDVTGKRIADDPVAQAALARGLKGIVRTRTIVSGLLAFAKAGAAPEPGVSTDVAAVMRDLMEELGPLSRERGIELTLGAVPKVAVRCSAGVLTSILSNLVRNAIKYMGESPTRNVIARAAAGRASLRVEIEDTGPGIPAALEQTIFEPYVRAPGSTQAGIGLGLATVKRLVESHGGAVGLRSTVGVGSTFWFELPLADAGHQAARSTPSPSSAGTGSG